MTKVGGNSFAKSGKGLGWNPENGGDTKQFFKNFLEFMDINHKDKGEKGSTHSEKKVTTKNLPQFS